MSEKKRTAAEAMDYVFNKVIPKKFLVFVIATVLAVWGLTKAEPWLTGEQWSNVAMAYLASNAVLGGARGVAEAVRKPSSGGQ